MLSKYLNLKIYRNYGYYYCVVASNSTHTLFSFFSFHSEKQRNHKPSSSSSFFFPFQFSLFVAQQLMTTSFAAAALRDPKLQIPTYHGLRSSSAASSLTRNVLSVPSSTRSSSSLIRAVSTVSIHHLTLPYFISFFMFNITNVFSFMLFQ